MLIRFRSRLGLQIILNSGLLDFNIFMSIGVCNSDVNAASLVAESNEIYYQGESTVPFRSTQLSGTINRTRGNGRRRDLRKCQGINLTNHQAWTSIILKLEIERKCQWPFANISVLTFSGSPA